MEKSYLIHTKEGNKVFTADEIISNAKEQEAKGIKPAYAFLDAKYEKPILPAGWLVWSTWDDGCGVVYKRSNGDYIIVTGWQSEFAFI